jgi:hypothetical protein
LFLQYNDVSIHTVKFSGTNVFLKIRILKLRIDSLEPNITEYIRTIFRSKCSSRRKSISNSKKVKVRSSERIIYFTSKEN